MDWIRDRVWQLGIGALLVLAGAWLAYSAAAAESPRATSMWIGLALIFLGLLLPLVTRLVEHLQEDEEEV